MMRAVEAEGDEGMLARVSRGCVSGTGSLRRLPPRVQRPDRGTLPPVFLSKSAEVIENKGQESQKERQEIKSAQAIENKGRFGRTGIARIKRMRIHLGLRGKGRTKRRHCQPNLG